jgi:pilus assembly protein Flp/PilA
MKTGGGWIGGNQRRAVLELIDDEQGATAVEYAILASLIAAVIAGTVQLLGERTQALFQSVLDAWP